MFGSGGTGFGGFGQQNQQNQQQQQQPGQTGGGLFGAQQQPSTGTGFGGFGAQPSNAFGGGNAGNSLFGQSTQQQPNQGGFTFGQSANNATSTPFGQSTNQAKPPTFGGFGASANNATPATGGVGGGTFGGFGNTTNQPSSSPFGAAGGNVFGAKPPGSLFGQPQSTNTFGQPAQGGGLFGSAGAIGGVAPMPTQGTLNPPYELKPQPEGPPDTPYDHDKKTPPLHNYVSITCMKPYRGASLEELRLQDYEQGRKSGNGGMAASTSGGFGQSTNTGFGAPAQTGGLFGQQQQSNAFGGGGGGGGGLFGQSNQQQSAQPTGGLFGSTNNAGGGGLFGQQQQNQPQTGGLFGQSGNTQQQPSTGFGFGAQQNTSSGFSFGQNNAQQQQNKPAGGGLFGGFGSTNQAAPAATTGFNFGGTNTQNQPATSGTFGASTGGFGFGATQANANQPKPGGLFGAAPATSTAPTFGGFGATAGATDNKPAFSFGGGGFGNNTSAGQTSTNAPTGGLFGATQPTTTSQPNTGFSFGAPSGGNTAGANNTGGLFGNQQNQQNTGGFGATSGGLFGNKPATTGGLFGQQQTTQQPASTGFSFGANNTGTGNTGGLFGNTQQNKPAGGGLFGNLGSNTNQQQPLGGGLFGNNQSNTNNLGGTGGLFGGGSNTGGTSLFGNNNQQSTGAGMGGAGGGLFGSTNAGQSGGFNFGGQSSTGGGLGGSLFGNSQQQQNNQQAANIQVSLNSNPYGTDALFGGQAGALNGSALGGSTTNINGIGSQPHLPFNVSLSRSSAKKQPPIVPPFRPSSRNSIRITKLRGSTPGFRESTPGREGTPGPSNSLFQSSPAPSSVYQRLSSPSPSVFRGLSDDLPRGLREGSIPASAPLPPQAFVNRPSVKRLVLDDSSRNSVTGLGRSNSLFSSRTASATPTLFERDGTPARGHVNFSPALETAASMRGSNRLNEGDSSFASTVFSPRKIIDETPSKPTSIPISSTLPALNRSGKTSKEDSLLPLDYWTSPPLSELREWSHAELEAVEGFIVGRKGFGQVAFQDSVDLTTVGELSNVPGGIVILRTKECIVYPDEDECIDEETGKQKDGVQPGFEPRKMPGGKATQGKGLNVPAIVKLEKCWPYDRATRLPIKDSEHIRFKQLINKLKRRADAHYVDFEAESGTWSFRVDHFSRYGLDETDEDATDEEATQGQKKIKRDGKEKGRLEQKAKDRKDDGNHSEDDDMPPPVKALGEVTDDDDDDSMIGFGTPRGIDRQETPRANVRYGSVADSIQGSNVAATSVASQPWAASLGLEPRRVQVMQASFFGDGSNNRKQVEEVIKGAPKLIVKQSRLASPTFTSSQTGTVASRSTFLGPVSQGISPTARIVPPPSSTKDTSMDIFSPSLSMGVSAPRPRKFSRLDSSSTSVVEGGYDIALDAGLSMGRSFRIGWGPNGVFSHRSKLMGSSLRTTTSGDQIESLSTVLVNSVKIFRKSEADKEKEKIEKLLKIQLDHSIIDGHSEDSSDRDDCPSVFPQSTLRFHHFIASMEGMSDNHYETGIFKLGSALFDEVDTNLKQDSIDNDRGLLEEVYKIRRRNNVANWIRWYSADTIRAEIRGHSASTGKNSGEQSILSQLSGGFFEEACKQAIDIGNIRLGTLIAQASSGGDEDEYRMDINDQLAIWRSGGVDAFISTEYRKILEMLGGNVLWSKGNGKREEGEIVKDLKIASGLDWIRSFALFLHYDCKFQDDLSTVLEKYEDCIGGEADIVPPLPPYLEKEIRPGSQKFRDAIRTGDYHRDVLFHLLKLYCDSTYQLENVLQPLSYGDSKLNFSIAFHSAFLLSKVINTRDFSDRVDLGVDNYDIVKESNIQGNSGRSDRLCIDFALQLETLEMWKWSAFILLHLEMSDSRKENIVALLIRYADEINLSMDRDAKEQVVDDNDETVAFLVNTLKIPIEWLYTAKADRASSREEKWQEYKYSLCGNSLGRAHDIAVRYLAPEGIIRHDFEFILQLFSPFQKSHYHRDAAVERDDGRRKDANDAAMEDVPGWSQGGQIYIDYIAICKSLPYLLNSLGKSPSNSGPTSSTRVLSDKDKQSSVEKITNLAEKIPKLMADIKDLFEAFTQSVTITVAQTQMITSLYTCIRMVKTAPMFKIIDLDLEDVQQVSGMSGAVIGKDDAAKGVAIEVENLQFFANDYCSMLVGAA